MDHEHRRLISRVALAVRDGRMDDAEQARLDLRAWKIHQLVAEAPPLDAARRDKLVALLRGGAADEGAA